MHKYVIVLLTFKEVVYIKRVLDLEQSLARFISGLSENVLRPELADTPSRFSKHLIESLSGYNQDPKKHVKLFASDGYQDLVKISSVYFASVCEHHLLPFYGYVDIAYVPGKQILGLSKFARIIDVFSKRLQVQEKLTKQISDFLYENLRPKLLIVHISAKHTCMISRGVLRSEASTETMSIKGDIKNNQLYIDQFTATLRERPHGADF